jgi:hypothetical protein
MIDPATGWLEICQYDDKLQIDCYVDADFAGIFLVADKQDLVSVKSQTGYVIMY